jgi:adenosylhomocysteine nucleosidase
VVSGESNPKPTRGVGWAFLFALRRESAPFTRRLRFAERLPAPCPATLYETKRGPAVVLETGIGAKRAAAAIRWLLDNFEPRLVVVCGYAGALSATLRVGDVLLASEVVEPADELRWRTAVPAELGDLPVGRLVTVSRLIATSADKRSLARQTGAVMVDMESAAIAEACKEARVPCAVVRAISDTAETELSKATATIITVGGRVLFWELLAAVFRAPGFVVEMWRLARDSRIAARALAGVLQRLL